MICKFVLVLAISSSVFCAPTVVTEQEPEPILGWPNNNNNNRGLLGCARSQYSCKTGLFQKQVCLGLEKLCDGVKDCPGSEDEVNDLCQTKELIEQLKKQSKEGIQNDFAGTGFMFSVGNLVVSGGSKVKMFNQNSDNIADPKSIQTIISNGQGQQDQQNQLLEH